MTIGEADNLISRKHLKAEPILNYIKSQLSPLSSGECQPFLCPFDKVLKVASPSNDISVVLVH